MAREAVSNPDPRAVGVGRALKDVYAPDEAADAQIDRLIGLLRREPESRDDRDGKP